MAEGQKIRVGGVNIRFRRSFRKKVLLGSGPKIGGPNALQTYSVPPALITCVYLT